MSLSYNHQGTDPRRIISIGISIVEIKRPNDCIISTIGFPVGESGVGSDGGMIRHPSLSQKVFALLLRNKVFF